MKNIVSYIDILNKWSNPKGWIKFFSFTSIMILQFFIYRLIYITGGSQFSYSSLMYIPLIAASFSFGTFGGFIFAITGGLLLGPYMPLNTSEMVMQNPTDWIYRLISFIVIGLITGTVMEFLLRTIRELNKITFYHPITHLPNRKYFEGIKIKSDYRSFLLVIELSNYSQLMNNLGYEFTVKLIQEFHQNISKLLKRKERSQIFHFQENKFAVVIANSDENEVFERFSKLNHMPLKVNDIEVHPYVFIGATHCEGDSCNLVKKAELARIAGKKNLRHCSMYIPELTSKLDKNFKLFEEFPRALSHKEFFLCYHPKIDASTKKVIGAEVLIRWLHPLRGLVGPNEFIPYLETTTFILEITKWVLKKSLRSVNLMAKQGINISLSVNIPLKILEDSSFMSFLKELHSLKLPLDKIVFEVLEREYVEDFHNSAKAMIQAKKMGIKFSLDDFGTGYSTISYVKKLPFDIIKMDKMFIRDLENNPENQDIVTSSVNMAHTMGIKVTAEGVESRETMDLLKNMNCDYIQGYYFTVPLKYNEFTEWFNTYEKREEL